MRELTGLKRAETTTAARRAASRWGARQAVLLLGAFITAAAIGTGVVLHVRRPRPPFEDVEALSPASTAVLWVDLRRGVDQQSPWEEQYRYYLTAHRRWMNAVGFLAALGLVTSAGSLLIPGSRARQSIAKSPPASRRE